MTKSNARKHQQEDDDSASDSDQELQIALKKGLLKGGLNVALPSKRAPINNTNGLLLKLQQFSKPLPWVERLDVTVTRPPVVAADAAGESREDDFAREISFQKQAQAAMMACVPRLQSLGMPTARPADYFAENAKTDHHMKKVRETLLTMQKSKIRSETAKKLREQRKFASKVQKDVLAERQKDKKQLMEAVKKHRKGMKDQLATLLGDAKAEQIAQQATSLPKKHNPNQQKKVTKKQAFKDSKYGFGGRKKRGKYNTKESASDMSGFRASVNSNAKKGGAGKNKRMGKSRRLKQKNK